MARLIWTEPALNDLDAVADYIALDKPSAAGRFVRKVFDRVARLEQFPYAGKRPLELPGTPYREVIVAPSRIFYRVEKDTVFILHVIRTERFLRPQMLEE
ncbi:MAG: type II toxin-antitoxin system RelE/ParE family toxin [Candidatus Sumerlaeota bacterium]|nr:type II toxin-antitoxin system RelE/ParE family toxin [Candidatus Sumerlaeota bacterium]